MEENNEIYIQNDEQEYTPEPEIDPIIFPRKTYTVVLSDGTSFVVQDDGVGNFITSTAISEDELSPDNITEVTIKEGNATVATLYNQVLRTYYPTGDGGTFIRLSDMTELEKIEADYNAKLDYIACMTGVDLDE